VDAASHFASLARPPCQLNDPPRNLARLLL
jgi:hypothetical protein